MTSVMRHIVKKGLANIRREFAELERLPEEKQVQILKLAVISALVVMTLIAWHSIARYKVQSEVFRFGNHLLVAPSDGCKTTTVFGPSQ